MPSDYAGMGLTMRISSARPGEAQFRDMTVDQANETLRRHVRTLLERKYPGADITVETGGDRPSAEITGVEDRRVIQAIRYDAEKTALAVKWDFSTLGLGLKPL